MKELFMKCIRFRYNSIIVMRIQALYLIVFAAAFISCEDKNSSTPEDPLADYTSTYAVIQGEIWDKTCISCHVSGSSFARQSDLILTSDVSYSQLINRAPDNEDAKADGLLLVGDEGLESFYKSFLWEKINAPDQEHFYEDHPGYGTQMPLGDDPLTNGQLEFIRQWILAGAPETGDVVLKSVLDDTSRYQNLTFEPLAIPEKGYQFHISPFEIPANTERELFIYEPLNNPEPIYISGFEISMKSGSHHFILYNFPNSFNTASLPNEGVIRDVYNANGDINGSTLFHMQYHQFVAGTQVPKLRYNYPAGVALQVPANTGFDLNSHYANKKDVAVTGEVYANVYTTEASEVEHVAKILNLNNDNFFLPAGKVTTITKSYTFQEDRHIFQLWSHAHSHNTSFKVFKVATGQDDELVYFSNDWEHPPILQIDPPMELKAGESLRLEAVYDNWGDEPLSFGLRSTDEMMILFGAYYE
ncbi:MAG: hypothetical protein ACJAVY_002514 [Marinoscillum sp.]|jgi:hypothetical protein